MEYPYNGKEDRTLTATSSLFQHATIFGHKGRDIYYRGEKNKRLEDRVTANNIIRTRKIPVINLNYRQTEEERRWMECFSPDYLDQGQVEKVRIRHISQKQNVNQSTYTINLKSQYQVQSASYIAPDCLLSKSANTCHM